MNIQDLLNSQFFYFILLILAFFAGEYSLRKLYFRTSIGSYDTSQEMDMRMHGLPFTLERAALFPTLFGNTYYAIGILTSEQRKEERRCFQVSEKAYAQFVKEGSGWSYLIEYDSWQKGLDCFLFKEETGKPISNATILPHVKPAGTV